MLVPQFLKQFDAVFVRGKDSRNGEVVFLPDPVQERTAPDEQIPGIFHRVQEFLQALDEKVVLDRESVV